MVTSGNSRTVIASRRGFTLIELLIVVVLIGILATIAIPKFSNTKEKAYLASMKSDLRNLAVSQESYLYDNAVYAAAFAALTYTASSGVTIVINEGTVAGWSATASHAQATESCYMYVGNAAPVGSATAEGQPDCS